MLYEYHEWFYLGEPSDFEIMTYDTIITETEGYCDKCCTLHILCSGQNISFTVSAYIITCANSPNWMSSRH